MPGVNFTVEFDQRPVIDALARLAAVGERPEKLMKGLGERLVISTQRRFDTNVAPDGTPWAPLNAAYAEVRRPSPILVQSGDLRNFIHSEASGRTVRIGSSMIYAAVHQFGAVIKPVRAKALVFELGTKGVIRVKSVRIPARPYLGISAADAEMIIEDTLAFVERVFEA